MKPTVGEPAEYRIMEEVLDDLAKSIVMHADKWNWNHDDFVAQILERVSKK